MIRSSYRSGLKGVFKTFGLLLLIAGYITGLYFASYDFDHQKLIGYMLTVLILASLIASYILIQLFWWIKRRRNRGSPSRIYKVLALRKDDLVNEKIKFIEEKLNPILTTIEAVNIRITDDLFPRVIFGFNEENVFAFLNQVSLEVQSSEEIILRAVLRFEYPISLSIKKVMIKKDSGEILSEIQSSNYYSFFSNHPILYEEILKKKQVDELLVEMKENLELISFNGRFINGTINSSEVLLSLFQLSNLIHDVVMLKDFGDVAVEELVCYQCGDPFETTEDICTSCKSPRPICIVCLLDLKPSEKKIVVQTPCCDVYTHKDHIIAWLETDSKCPNCKSDQFLWLRKLKQEK